MPRASKAKARPDCGFTETGCNYSRKRAEITHGPKCPLLLAARKPKAQRERVVVAYAIVDVRGQICDFAYRDNIEEMKTKKHAEGAVSWWNDNGNGPHRVVRLEGRVKVKGGR